MTKIPKEWTRKANPASFVGKCDRCSNPVTMIPFTASINGKIFVKWYPYNSEKLHDCLMTKDTKSPSQ